MEPEKEAFLKAITADRYDQTTRWAFADWLEEHGYDDEAQEQRLWTREWQKSRDWLEDYASKINEHEAYAPYDLSKSYNRYIPEEIERRSIPSLTYEELMAAAKKHIESGGSGTRWLDFDIPDFVREQRGEFWRHYSIVTREDHGGRGTSFFRCSC